MNYLELKQTLGLAPTNLDIGFPPDFGSGKYAESDYLPGKTRNHGKARPALPKEDLSHLNSAHWKRMSRIGRKGGRRRAMK